MSIYLYLDSKRGEDFRVAERVMAVSGQHYEIGDRIDCGGNAVVHRCEDTITGDDYAVKFQLAISWKRLQRFKREIDLLKQSKHDQLISYIDHGQVVASHVSGNGRLRREEEVTLSFVIMTLAESNLKTLVQKRNSALPYEDYIGQFKGLARALGVLHEKAVHRDIKPENILIKGETWLLSDFGLCEILECQDDLTGVDEAVGPRYWMSPEAINRAIGNTDVISKQSDVFQLCSVFWFVVTGRHPSGSVSRSDWSGSVGLYSVLADALSHNQTRRPADGMELARRLDDATLPVTS